MRIDQRFPGHSRLRTLVDRQATLWTHRIRSLPVVVLMPHSRCDCRCVMCDIWKANRDKRELSVEQLAPVVDAFSEFGVRSVVLSGGEPLLHANLWALCRLLAERCIRVTLLSTGMTLERHAPEVRRWCSEVIVSVDGERATHDRIRRVDGAFDRLVAGVRALRAPPPVPRITGRCVVQRANYRSLADIVETAHDIPLDQISFLAADVTSTAFNRPEPWDEDRAGEVALDAEEAAELAEIVEALIADARADLDDGFIAESPDKLRRIARHFRAAHGACAADPPTCNAPWVSTVIEADGTVRPCFFHPPLGNIHEASLEEILNSDRAIAFRRGLDVRSDETCRNCVCTLALAPWQSGVREDDTRR